MADLDSALERMSLDLLLIRFKGDAKAAIRFGAMREGAGSDASWTHEVAIVEHMPNDRMSIRGTFAGHYVDVYELDHFSARGAAEGALTGALVGGIFGPFFGAAPGLVLGLTIGAVAKKPTEVEPAPEPLTDELREAVPGGYSAIVLLAAPAHVDAMLSVLGESDGEVLRRSLTVEQASALLQSVSEFALASSGPSEQGDDVGPAA